MISIHALREEGDVSKKATLRQRGNFYPRPPRGGRPPGDLHRVHEHDISIHALREEGDPAALPNEPGNQFISIHALREEGDLCFNLFIQNMENFYPRPPRGGRRGKCEPRASTTYFYPRPPRGGRQGGCP